MQIIVEKYIGEVVMRFCILLLSIFLTFGKASAGNDMSKILTGVAVGVATGGVGLAIGAAATVGEAVAAGVIAGTATAVGADPRVGVVCDGNGRNPKIETGFTSRNGETFVFRTGRFDKSRKEAINNITANVKQVELQRRIEEEFTESIYQEELKNDIKFAFDSAIGWDCNKLTSNLRSFDCANNGEITVLAESDTRGWDLEDGKTIFDSFSKFNPEDDDGKKAVKSFIFEETPLAWHFGREKINGQWYNRAWTDTNMDLMVKEGERINVSAPEWYTNKRHQDAEWFSFSSDRERVRQEVGEGLLEEFGWSNVRAIDLLANNRIDEGREAVKQGLFYYDLARKVLKTRSLGVFSKDGMNSIRAFGEGKIEWKEYIQNWLSEKLDVKEIAATAVMTSIRILPGVQWKAAATAGVVGLKFLKKEIRQELKQVLDKYFVRKDDYAFSGVPNSRVTNTTTNLRKRTDAPRNVKGSGGGGSSLKDPEKAPRKVSTEQDAKNYINGLKIRGKLSKKGKTKDGHEYYKIMEKIKYRDIKFKKGDYLSRDELHHEWEWFRGKDKHQGAIDSITGKLFEDSAVKGRTLKLP